MAILPSSGEAVATEGEEEEEEISLMHNSMAKEQEGNEILQGVSEEEEELTPYVAKCCGHVETLRKRKRDQEEQVETLVEETFAQIEAIMQEIMRGLQQRHVASREQFEATDHMLTHSLRAHNRDDELMAIAAAATDTRMDANDRNDLIQGPAGDESSSESDGEVDDDQGETDDGYDALGIRNPLVKGLVPTTKTFDRVVKVLISKQAVANLYFTQWNRKWSKNTQVKQLRMAFEELLPRLLGARDYAGAAKVLEVMYHRFTVTPAVCIEASLEILRRQPEYRNDLLEFYEAALNAKRIDKLLILKEMWLFHIVHGEFYEAYHLYQDKITQMAETEGDPKLLADFGIVCYWLMLIESKEFRDMLKREDVDNEDEDDEGLDSDDYEMSESIESVIESNYLFKTPIGVHILYQHASNALRRAVALSPNSAMFVEYYVQLLVLVGEIQPACDYLEAFYHMNPNDPHAARMFAGFLGCYYPDSVNAQVAVFTRWMKNDPSCKFPLEKMLELSSAGAVSSFVLTTVLVDALDTCGSDVYVAQNPDMALALWRNLAELLAAMDEDEFLQDQVERGETDPSNQVSIADVGERRQWWKRVYFARPRTVQEVIAVAQRDSTIMEVSIYRAAVADRLFPGQLPMVAVLHSSMTSPDLTFRHEHIRLFRSFFPSGRDMTVHAKAPTSFSDMPFIHVAVEPEGNRKKHPLPRFKGSSDTVHVIDRKSIVEREATGENAEVVITRAGKRDAAHGQLMDKLYQALESEVGYSSTVDKRAQRKRKANAISTSSSPVSPPAFVRMVEEEIYNNPKVTARHIFSTIYQKLRRSDMLVPTSKVMSCCVEFFRDRLEKQVKEYGHAGLMMRYEEFISVFICRQRERGEYDMAKGAKTVIEDMKRVLPSPHPHFPDEKFVEEFMRTKVMEVARHRRIQLMNLKKIMKPIVRKLLYVNDKAFVDTVYSVCKQHGVLGLISRVDIARILQSILPRHYYRILQRMSSTTRQLLASPEFREGCSASPEAIFEKLKTKASLDEIKAFVWVERFEALDSEESDSDSDSDSESDNGDELTRDTSAGELIHDTRSGDEATRIGDEATRRIGDEATRSGDEATRSGGEFILDTRGILDTRSDEDSDQVNDNGRDNDSSSNEETKNEDNSDSDYM
ncbi:hypothetical protein P3T76_014413 [Phytophthora citrophthora]|uniref:Uncharacterized protein n=1 Tax=Phytophthora citrophthora TaxID=4793 RepID=A0AAD9G1P2_9STRA|nr:hypothetical protein P3T76_014413 [Phytophthora citrophthora]